MAAKTALVTGCSRGGIGDALARELHRLGYRVFAAVRDPSRAAHLAALGIEVLTMDVEDAESVRAAADEIGRRAGGSLNMLINNAGFGYSASLMDSDMSRARRVFGVNVLGVLAVTQACQRLLVAGGGGGGACVLNIGSVLGESPHLFTGVYGASKAALVMLSSVMRLELAPFGIQVIHVVTGGIDTPFIERSEFDLPADSIYGPAREHLGPIVEGRRVQANMKTSPDEYARHVIANATGPSPRPTFWYGAATWSIWFGSRFLPRCILDMWWRAYFGMDKVRAAVEGARRAAGGRTD